MNFNKNLTVVMYHYVRDLKNSRYPNIKGLQVELFKEQVQYLKKHYNFVKIEEIIDAFSENRVHELPNHPVLLTFDDAYKDHFEYVFPYLYNEHIQGAFFAPVKAVTEHTVLDVNKIHFILASILDNEIPKLLQEIHRLLDKYKIDWNLQSFDYYFNKLAVASRFDTKEVIFVKRLLQVELPETLRKIIVDELFLQVVRMDESTFSRELYMSIDQVRCMVNSGMHFGSHGYDHYWLNSLSKEKQLLEIKKSIEFLDMVGMDTKNWTICYPYGAYDDSTIDILRQYGCKLGMTTDVNVVNLSHINNDTIFKLPRLDTNDLPKNSNADVNDWYDK